MTVFSYDPVVEVFKALSEPIRLDIMARIVSVDELPCTTLERELPISKSTISYHMKILYRAHLIDIRKDGRYYHYRARRSEVEELVPGMLDWLGTRRTAAGEPTPG